MKAEIHAYLSPTTRHIITKMCKEKNLKQGEVIDLLVAHYTSCDVDKIRNEIQVVFDKYGKT